jgi:hypothetical protein
MRSEDPICSTDQSLGNAADWPFQDSLKCVLEVAALKKEEPFNRRLFSYINTATIPMAVIPKDTCIVPAAESVDVIPA